MGEDKAGGIPREEGVGQKGEGEKEKRGVGGTRRGGYREKREWDRRGGRRKREKGGGGGTKDGGGGGGAERKEHWERKEW